MKQQENDRRLFLSVILISVAGCLIYAASGAVRTITASCAVRFQT